MLVANESQLMYLFGDAKQAVDYYNKLPKGPKNADGLISLINDPKEYETVDLQKIICYHCKHHKMFSDCRHIVKRMVDRCEGAISELVWNDFMGGGPGGRS